MKDTKNYVEAFKRFAGVDERAFTLEMEGDSGAFVEYEDHEFRICRFADLLWEFKKLISLTILI